MAENVVINDTTYNGVDTLALVRADGSVATFYPDAVRYNEQTLTEEQKAQARDNIGIKEALIAVTDDITPAQVAEAVTNGRNVILTHIDGTYGSLCFNNFIYVPALGAVISSAIVFFAGDYLVVELVGSTQDGRWAALSKEVATVDDIPAPVICTTAEVTPSQVKELMDAGKPFAITHTDDYYGSMLFNSFVSAIGGIFSTTVFQLSGITYCAQLIADLTENQWMFSAFTLATTADIPESLKNPYALTINGTSYDGSKAVNIESIKGDTGQRGTGLLAVTTGPSSYTTAVGGITPKYRMSISTIKTQAGVTEVLLGDTIRYSYYHYPIAYLDDSYAYCKTRVSIRGATGSVGTSVTVTDVTENTDDGGSNVVTFSNGTTVTIKNGSKGSKGDPGESAESIPDYVRTEAERVAKVVQSRQNADTITFIAASDFHYSSKVSNAAQQKESLTYMGQAMELIRKMVHVDFTVSCGDMVWDSGETVDEAMAAMRFVSECLQSGAKDFRARGNHDCLYSNSTGLTDAQIFANVGAWNSGAQYDPDNRLGGYCYRDFDGVKIRVICLNSSESDSGGCLFSTKQVTWLSDVLNLSEKGEDWCSIVVSHHPLDWGKDGGGNPITAVNSAAGVIAAFHGHTHNFKVDTVTGTNIKRIAIPNACVGRENEYTTAYGITWGEDTKYSKTAGTASDTAFCVITIDRAARKIYADHYGAGYSREVEYSDTGDSGYTNAVLTAEADDSTEPYNGTGYKNGVYCSSNGGDSTDTACVATGNMPYDWLTSNPIYIKGASVTNTSHVRIYGYATKGSAPHSSTCCTGQNISTYFTMEELETGNYYKLTPIGNHTVIKYLRMSLIGTGENLIVTFNQPIE